MRLAYFSPLNPVASGISDYSEELLPHLASHAEIELVVDGYTPSNRALQVFPRRTLGEFRARALDYDVAIYHMGNSPAHASIYETLLEYPGVVVLHEVVLHHLRAWQTIERGDRAAYISALGAAYGDEVAEVAAQNPAAIQRFDYPLSEAVVQDARGVIVHSQYAAEFVARVAPGVPVARVPMGIAPFPEIDATEARKALGIERDTFLVTAFGQVEPHKRISVALEAFAEFSKRHPNARLALVGSPAPGYDAGEIIRALRLENVVRCVGFAPVEMYQNFIAASDGCLNLRFPSAGETSASLLRLLGAGKVTLVTRTGAYAELPDDVCVKIEPDAFERELLVEYLEYFYARPEARAGMGENARRYVQEKHTLEGAARAYADFLKGFLG